MVLELVRHSLAAAVARSTIHDALAPVGLVALGHVAFAATGHGLPDREGALVILALLDLGVHDFNGLAADVGGEAAAAFAALLAAGLNLVFVTPFGYRNVAEHGIRNAGGQGSLEARGRVARIVDGQGRGFIPAEQLVDHGGALLAAPEQGKGRRRSVERAADGPPVGNAALVGFQHGKRKLVVRRSEFLAHHPDDAVKRAVTAGIALVPVAFIGHGRAFVRIEFVRLPAELAAYLGETLTGSGRGLRRGQSRSGQPRHGAPHGQPSKSTKQMPSVAVHYALLLCRNPIPIVKKITSIAWKSESTESPRKTGFFVKIFRPALDAAEEGLTFFSARHGRLKLCIFQRPPAAPEQTDSPASAA